MTSNHRFPHINRFSSGMVLIVYNFDPVKIHVLVSPDDSFANATYIIETPNYAVLVDTQYKDKYSKDFKKYGDGLNKPGVIIITHAHPDHYLGLDNFEDIDRYALKEVTEEIKKNGEFMLEEYKKTNKNDQHKKLVLPNKEIKEGETVIDGVKFVYKKYVNAESEVQLVIELPELDTIIVQDIMSYGYHPWLRTTDLTNWIDILTSLRNGRRFSLVLPGHGFPAVHEAYDSMIRYLMYAQEVFKYYAGNSRDDKEDKVDDKDDKNDNIDPNKLKDPKVQQKIKEALVKKYPVSRRKGAELIDMYLKLL